MKYIILIAFMACGYAQYPRVRIDSHGRIVSYYNVKEQTQLDTIPILNRANDTLWPYDTIPVIMQVSDTLRSSQDTKIYWMKGYKVIADYDTYYLDILKQPLRKTIMIWLDQNL